MTTLELRVLKSLHGGPMRLGAVADILPLPGSARAPAGTGSRGQRNVVVPVGSSDIPPARVDVAPGRYVVRVTLPSGETVDEEVEVPAGAASLAVDLAAEDSSHEWLGMSHLLGAAPARAAIERRVARGEARAARNGGEQLLWFESATSAPAVRAWLGSDADVRAAAPRLLFGAPQAVGELQSQFADPLFALYEIADRSQLRATSPVPPHLVDLLGQDVAVGTPQLWTPRLWFALTDGARIQAIGPLPLPWHSVGQAMPIQILLREPARESGFPAGTPQPWLTVYDPEVTALLGFLGRNDLSAATAVLSRAVDWVYGKFDNPFAAAAGGYILLAADGVRDIPSHAWKSWIDNLANNFGWLADGAIQVAWLKLRSVSGHMQGGGDGTAETGGVVAEAGKRLRQAIAAGPPLCAVGVRLLVDGLTLVTDHLEATGSAPQDLASFRRALRLARWLALRVDPTQPFTVIRLP